MATILSKVRIMGKNINRLVGNIYLDFLSKFQVNTTFLASWVTRLLTLFCLHSLTFIDLHSFIIYIQIDFLDMFLIVLAFSPKRLFCSVKCGEFFDILKTILATPLEPPQRPPPPTFLLKYLLKNPTIGMNGRK